MTRRSTLILIVVGLLVGGWFVTGVASRLFFTPRADLVANIADATDRLERRRAVVDDRPRVDRAIDAIVARTLGGDVETVDHRLRSRLNRIAESLGLSGVTVGTGNATRRLSPARTEFKGRHRELRDEIDFVELEGWISASASYEDALRLVATLEAEPWIKRIGRVGLDETGNGDRVEVSVRLATLFLPGRTPPTPSAAAEPVALAQLPAELAGRNPFRLPPPVTPAAAEPTVVQTPPPPRPRYRYEQWTLTGLADAGGGSEAWLLNRASGEARRLAVGERLEDAVLVAIENDTASFDLADARITLSVGDSLGDARRRNPKASIPAPAGESRGN